VVYLGIDMAGPEVTEGLKVAADVTGVIVWTGIGYLVVRLVAGLLAPVLHKQTLLGSSAEQSRRLGGTKTGAMQA
jgi:hypothetical protein